MNEDLSKALPKVPTGLGWEIAVSGDGTAGTVTIRLKDLFEPKRHLVGTEYEIPKSATASGLVGGVANEARNLLAAYERGLVLATFPGTYDLGWTPIDIDEEEVA